MRAIWKGSVSFGLVNVPVKLYSTIDEHDLDLHQVHVSDGGRIRYERRCQKCGEVVQFADIRRGYDDGERVVVLTDDDVDALPAERDREIAIQTFVPGEQISPLAYHTAYQALPDGNARKPYSLLTRTLAATDRVAIATVALRARTRLAVLRVIDDVLVVHTLYWADEVRALEKPEASRVSKQEIDMALSLVDAYLGDFDPDAYTDEYQAQLKQLVAAKLKAGDGFDSAQAFADQEPKEAGDGKVVDLMEALRRSIDRARSAS